jgi:PhzF family phenazine biosynthesis protein
VYGFVAQMLPQKVNSKHAGLYLKRYNDQEPHENLDSIDAPYFSCPLWLVDAFTGKSVLGNPAGICIVSEFPSVGIMQGIAFEMQWSETAFLKKLSSNKFHIRWFSPEDEAPMCGHATLAAAHFLSETKQIYGDSVTFLSNIGQIDVDREFYADEVWYAMDFPACYVKSGIPDEEKLYDVLGTSNFLETFSDSLLYIVRLESELDVRECKPNLALLKDLPCRAVVITANSSEFGFDFVSRYFAPKVGINEDPVCGSAHCRLAPIWCEILAKTDFTAKQVSRRGGILRLSFLRSVNRVRIAGTARTIVKGVVSYP